MKSNGKYKGKQYQGVGLTPGFSADYIFIAAIAIFLIIVPFFRGLYFRENYLPSITILSGIFILFALYKFGGKDFYIMGSKLDYAVFGLFAAYLIAFFFSVNSFSAYDSILVYASYLLIYILAANLSRTEGKLRVVLYSAIISIFIIAFIGHLVYAGIIDIRGAMQYNRLYGLYQYPNATGSVLGAGILICVGYISKCKKVYESIIVHIALSTIFAAFILTLSVGAFLVFAAVILLYFIVVKVKDKLNMMLAAATMLISNLPLFLIFFKGTYNQLFIIMYAISLIMSVVSGWFLYYLNSRWLTEMDQKRAVKIVLISIGIILLLVVAAFFIFKSNIGPAVDKLWSEELKSSNAQDRITFTKDGFKIFKDNVIFGAGGGAWKDLYFKYQSFSYPSTEAHNYYIQLMIETGLVGLAALLAVLYFVFVKGIKAMKSDDGYITVPLYMGIIMLLGHAVLDFDLSLTALMYLLMFLIGAASGEREPSISSSGTSKVVNYVVLALAFFIFVSSFMMSRGIAYGVDAAEAIEQDMDEAVVFYEKAMSFDRFNSAYKVDYSQIMAAKYQQTEDKKYIDNMHKRIDEMLKQEPYNIRYYPTIISLLLSNGMIDRGIELANEMVLIRPFSEDAYSTKIQVNYEVAKAYFNNKDYKKAIVLMDSIIESEKQMKETESRSIKPFKFNDKLYQSIDEIKKWKTETEEVTQTTNN